MQKANQVVVDNHSRYIHLHLHLLTLKLNAAVIMSMKVNISMPNILTLEGRRESGH